MDKPCIKCGSVERYANGACKSCAKAYAKDWRARHPEKHKILRAKWIKQNPERVKAIQLAGRLRNKEKEKFRHDEYRALNKEKLRLASKKYREENKERIKRSNALYYAANKEACKARTAAWAARNAEHERAKTAQWAAANKDLRRIHKHNRRAKESSGKLSSGLSKALYALQRGKCACGCRQPLGDDYHLDHRMPLALGGTNTDDNMQLLRATCNLQKNAKHPVDFMQERGFLI